MENAIAYAVIAACGITGVYLLYRAWRMSQAQRKPVLSYPSPLFQPGPETRHQERPAFFAVGTQPHIEMPQPVPTTPAREVSIPLEATGDSEPDMAWAECITSSAAPRDTIRTRATRTPLPIPQLPGVSPTVDESSPQRRTW